MELLNEKFYNIFHRRPEAWFSAPGRTEIGGNHTDHQHGKVLAAAVNLAAKAAVAPNGDGMIRIQSEGYAYFEIDLSDLTPVSGERNTTMALVRGVAAGFAAQGHRVTGFDAYVSSSVLPGSGLSSSAAFEVLIGTVINELDACGLSPVEIARIGQYAENVYFGKPSGLMDQTASAVGNLLTIDFADPAAPAVRPLDVDFRAFGHSLCILDSGADHADLTAEYAAITAELKTICRYFGREVLREVEEERFYAELPALRRAAGDRAVLRAMHIFEENRRVDAEVAALEQGDFPAFLALVRASGRSSWLYLQNVVPTGSTVHQALAFTLALCERVLGGRGACRVHGGGFGGTVQAFVPTELLDEFKAETERVLGTGSCHVLTIRREGGIRE